MRAVLIACALAVPMMAHAAPPKVGSEDYAIMIDFKEWVESQHAGAQWCCNWSDGRPLFEGEWRETSDGYEVFVSRRHWDDAPDPGVWIKVPRDRVVSSSPIGLPVAWYMGNFAGRKDMVFCFAPVGGV